MRVRGWFLLGCLVLGGFSLAGCASVGTNVRALRMYEHEQVTPALLHAHIRQMADALRLIDVLVNQTPYQPGAPWIASLPIDGPAAQRARDLLQDASEKASLVRVYAQHLSSVLKQAEHPLDGVLPKDVGGVPLALVPGYGSLSNALAGINPSFISAGSKRADQLNKALDDVNRRYTEFTTTTHPNPEELARIVAQRDRLAQAVGQLRADATHPVSAEDLAAALRDPEHARIVQDALTVVSVALRLANEAIALATVIGLEAATLAQQSPQNWLRNVPDTANLAVSLPDDARRIFGELQADAKGLGDLLALLSQLKGVNPLDTAGYEFKSGLIDDVVGVAWDSVHVDVHGGGEALFYNALATDDKTTDSKGNTFDYTGRQTRLEYKVDPIVLAHVALSVKIDWPHWAEALGLNFAYASNRVYKSGGDIGDGALASQLGVKGALSEALDAGLGIAGVKAAVRVAHFTNGTVRDILVADGSLLADAPLKFDMTQIDIGYDIAPRQGTTVLQKLTLGFRYFDYSLPRILYEFANSTPGADHAAYVFTRETPPQAIRTRLYMLDIATRIEKNVTPHFTPYLNMDVAFGYGPTRYYFLRDPNGDDVPSNQEYSSSSAPGIGFASSLGFRWKIGNPEWRFNAFLDLNYHVQFLSSILDSKDEGATLVDFGTMDVFHGPMGAFGATF